MERSTTTRLVTIGLFVTLIGCASSYRMSPESLQIRSGLTEERARALILDSFKEIGPHYGGLYSAGPSQGKPWDVKLDGTVLSYMNHSYPVPVGTSRNYYGQITVHTATREGKYSVDLRKLSKIRIQNNDGKQIQAAPVQGYVIWFYETNLKYGCVNVSQEKLNDTLAALTYFSPNA